MTLERSERPAAGEPAGARSAFPRVADALSLESAAGRDQAVLPNLRAFVARAAR